MYSVVPLVNRNVLRAPRAANASVCYARESVTEGTGRTRLIVRLSQCNVLARTGSMVKLGAVLPHGLAEKLRNCATTLLYERRKRKESRVQPAWRFKIMLRLRYMRISTISVHIGVYGETETDNREFPRYFTIVEKKHRLARRDINSIS